MSLRPEIEEEYKEAFALFDKDSDGKMTKQEFIKILENLGIENFKKKGEDMLKEVGATDFLVYDQFRQAFLNRMKLPFKKKEMIEAFQTFDTEKTGKLLDIELKQIFTQMNSILEEAEINRMIAECEPDKKGLIEYMKLVDKMYTVCYE